LICLYLADLYTNKVCWHHFCTNIHNLSGLFALMCLLARCYTVLIHKYLLEPVISHSSSYTNWVQGMLLTFLINLDQLKVFVMNR